MKKLFLIFVILISLTTFAFAAGDQNHGDKGQGNTGTTGQGQTSQNRGN